MQMMNRTWVENALEEYAKEARRLKQKLFLERYPINNTTDAERYLRENLRYNFIVDMFGEMSCTEWSKDDFNADLK
jgi:hypothetical protein